MIKKFQFINNKYTIWYYNLIAKARNRTNKGYIENHHIIPRALGGDHSKENRIDLTAREHFICHLLLVKMVSGKYKYKMASALHKMTFSKNKNQLRIFTSQQYELVRKIHSKNNPMKQEKIVAKFRGEGNPMYGKKRPDTSEWNTKTKAKTYIFINPQGKLVNIHNLYKFCQENNLDQGNMWNVANGNAKQYKGWTQYV